MSESTQRRKYMLLSIRHLIVSRQKAPERKSEIRSSKSETSGSSPNQSLPQKRNNLPRKSLQPHSLNRIQ